jgi:hypothetical protein
MQTHSSPSQGHDHKAKRTNRWIVGALASVAGFVVSQVVTLFMFYRTLDTTRQVEMVHLARDLAQEFYVSEENKAVYRPIRTAIESCEKLYRSNGGAFGHDDINTYLGFFDDLGFYWKKGAIDLDIIDQEFGAYIIEAYEYPELREYIKKLEQNAKQRLAFAGFEKLTQQLEKNPERRDLAASWHAGNACLKTAPTAK